MDFKSKLTKLKTFILECKRVYLITKKPTNEEFKAIVKVTSIGLVIIGAIGFVIFTAAQLM